MPRVLEKDWRREVEEAAKSSLPESLQFFIGQATPVGMREHMFPLAWCELEVAQAQRKVLAGLGSFDVPAWALSLDAVGDLSRESLKVSGLSRDEVLSEASVRISRYFFGGLRKERQAKDGEIYCMIPGGIFLFKIFPSTAAKFNRLFVQNRAIAGPCLLYVKKPEEFVAHQNTPGHAKREQVETFLRGFQNLQKGEQSARLQEYTL
ncbi:MAG: hypothetical protein HGA90_03450 [Alphaproteobacteria bacterium]|nr:hypothetical protein [Alphaproteobacteria bacterium]